MTDTMPVIQAEHIKKHFPMRQKKVLKAVDDVSLRIDRGEILGIVGESGCGKSTLGRALLRLILLTEGKLLFQGEDISALDRREMKPFRPRMQMIFQNPFASFNPKQRLDRALQEVGRVHGMSAAQVRDRVGDAVFRAVLEARLTLYETR